MYADIQKQWIELEEELLEQTKTFTIRTSIIRKTKIESLLWSIRETIQKLR